MRSGEADGAEDDVVRDALVAAGGEPHLPGVNQPETADVQGADRHPEGAVTTITVDRQLLRDGRT